MHPLAILVVWKFPDFGRSEVEKKKIGKFFEKILSHLSFTQGILER